MIFQPVTIQQVITVVDGFTVFVFNDGHGITYQPGQYLTFVHRTAHEELRRSYSIISTPLLHEPLAIGVRRITNGAFSRFLIDHEHPGDVLLTTGAAGFFILPPDTDAYKQVFFLAAGSGITPILSLLKTLLYGHPDIDAVLIYSSPSQDATAFYRELIQLQRDFSTRFTLRFLFGNTPDLREARLNRELLTQLLIHHQTSAQTLFYLCGPESYMRMCLYTLQEAGVPPANIRRENFIGDKKLLPHRLPPDRATHRARIRYQDQEFIFDVPYPDSILAAAKKQGISLPYSCETGRCGSCAARCVEGQVWLSYNEVLTDKELADGLTLTCVGHPVGGDITLSL